MSIVNLDICKSKLASLQAMIPIKDHERRLIEIDDIASKPNAWDNPKQATALMKERQKLSDILTKLTSYNEQVSFYSDFVAESPGEVGEVSEAILTLKEELIEYEFKQLLCEPTDDNPAILTINAGAGGLEAANWVTMLSRMYLRWADANGYKIEIMDEQPSEEHSSICTDSISVRIVGPYAYGFLKGESGIARLIRNSPFNAGDARHTSFAAVSVTPDIEDTIDIIIEDKDIEITAQRSSGKGGQNTNKVSSAIRLKHLPTGISVLARTERDQLANKKNAFRILKSKLFDLEVKKREAERDGQIAQQSNISFGHQIRTYTMSPYTMVKDHRTEHENTNVGKVMDGDITGFLESYLRTSAKKKSK